MAALIPDSVEGTSPSHDLKDYIGDYKHPAYGTINISLSDSGLVFKRKPFISVLKHYHYDVFRTNKVLQDRRMQFHYDFDGNIEKLTMRMEVRLPPVEFQKVESKK